ncbi:hypothetical protein SAMD00019534_099380 [Acytostelium subglobosum LB1]|uniref:hypothetical protein n=1 Tax=Acytostelium subglobosum LB1 TaxID=1410327 RepID=UPI000644C491|nr:hypothetical protein SAMD00019534_099380 [Acytostelium subglobosum LB1]GAM26763.1 hypothetical protein SAMD00019534_099380 [Acytostelium subglobosum LB1]|eukprot:XP_012750424.1 hypothetical protein SAMD00019534_099380 [Acytostelium subglobosum LB1]
MNSISLVSKSSSSILFNASIGSMSINGLRYVSNLRNNQPRVRRTTCILSNGATISVRTSLPYAKKWRSTLDVFNTTPDFEFDSIKEIKERRKKFADDKYSEFKK